PALGGILTDRLSWRWVFFVTVPFSAVSALAIGAFLRERVVKKAVAPIDWPGAALLSSGTTALLVAVLGGGDRPWAWTAGLLAVAAALFVAFVRQERHAADPILPLDLMVRRVIAASVVGSFLVGGLLFGIDTYIPLFVQ